MSNLMTAESRRVTPPGGAAQAVSPERHSLSLWQRLDQSGVPLLMARLILGGMFLWMGYQKITHPVEFLKQVRMYEMVPAGTPYLLNAIAIILPWMEVVTGLLLLAGIFLRGAALVQLVMLVVFSGAVFLRALHVQKTDGTPFFDIAFDCGCGSGVVVIWTKLVTNLGLMALTLVPLLSRSRRFCLGR